VPPEGNPASTIQKSRTTPDEISFSRIRNVCLGKRHSAPKLIAETCAAHVRAAAQHPASLTNPMTSVPVVAFGIEVLALAQ
jgi:hypothetical protein